MAILTEAGYIAARAAGDTRPFHKLSIANATAGAITALWRSTGPLPTQPAIPGAAVVCDNTTPGALNAGYVVNGSNTAYIDDIRVSATNAGTVYLLDRLIHSGNLNGTLTTLQAVNTPALPSRASADKCTWYLEWYTDTGGTATTATVAVTYTDTTTGNIPVALAATMRAGRRLQIPPAAGKVIASVQSVTLAATTGAAGAFGVSAITQVGPVMIVPSANLGDRQENACQQYPATACLELSMLCATTATGDVRGNLRLIQG